MKVPESHFSKDDTMKQGETYVTFATSPNLDGSTLSTMSSPPFLKIQTPQVYKLINKYSYKFNNNDNMSVRLFLDMHVDDIFKRLQDSTVSSPNLSQPYDDISTVGLNHLDLYCEDRDSNTLLQQEPICKYFLNLSI